MSSDSPALHEEARGLWEVLRLRREGNASSNQQLLRQSRELYLSGCGKPEPVTSIERIDASGVQAVLYRPTGGERAVFVWFHGGGWLSTYLDCYDCMLRTIANRAECAVLSVHHRCAPEHPYPAAVEDCWTATKWASREFLKVAVGGDSSGGNLAAAVALRARDEGLRLAIQMLVYPVLDYAALESSFVSSYRRRYQDFEKIQGFGNNAYATMAYIWETYVPDPVRRLERDASPLRAQSLAGVTRALMITAEHDILRGENEEYARRLAAEGVAVELIQYKGQLHGFYPLLGSNAHARDAAAQSSRALEEAFASESAERRSGRRVVS